MFRASSLEKELDSPVTQFSTASGEDSDNTSKSKVGIPPLRVLVLSEFRDNIRICNFINWSDPDAKIVAKLSSLQVKNHKNAPVHCRENIYNIAYS